MSGKCRLLKKGLVLAIAMLTVFCIGQPAAAVVVHQDAAFTVGQPQLVPVQPEAMFSWAFSNFSLFRGHVAGDVRLERARSNGVKGINSIIAGLNMGKASVQRSKLPDDVKNTLVSEVNSNITWFDSKKSAIMASMDQANVTLLTTQAQDRWNAIKVDLKKQTGLLACDDIGADIANARNASAVASQKVAAMKANGSDAVNAEKALSSYNSHLDNAVAHLNDARAEFNSISSSGNVDRSFGAGLKQLGQAQDELNASYQDLRGIYVFVLHTPRL